MIFDKLSLFADGLVVPTTANATTYSKVIDLRKNTFIDPLLRVYGQVVGTVNATGSVTTKVQVSDNATSWTDLVSFTQDGMYLIRCCFPIMNKKRYMRLAFVVGGTALGSAVTVKAGLVDQFDMSDVEGLLPAAQTFPPLQDLTDGADALAEELELGAPSALATEGTAATIDYVCKKGTVTTIIQSSESSVTTTFANGVVEVKTTSGTGDGTYTIGLVDGLGIKHTLSVVVANA